jgi:hypothetical protein
MSRTPVVARWDARLKGRNRTVFGKGVTLTWKALAVGCFALAVWGCEGSGGAKSTPHDATTATAAAPAEAAQASAERGRYLVRVSGCNDCRTPGCMEKGTGVPESEWLTGVPVGWKGPWGTTYASNLRLFVRDFDEDTFVQVVRSRNSRPPMPWPNLHAMSDADLRSVFRYIRSLPAKGERMPEYVPPGREPATAYVEMAPQMPKGADNLR